MRRFLTRVILEELPVKLHERPFRVVYPIEYLTHVVKGPNGEGTIITVPANYTTDFASTPRTPLLSWAFPQAGQARRAAIIHDWLVDEDPHTVDSKTAAKIFNEAMRDIGVTTWRRYAMYRAVRWFGPRFKSEV